MNHYQITAFVNKIKLRNMTQTEIKKLASEIIGDGQTPNMWFVTYGPYVAFEDGNNSYDFELIEGRDDKKDTYTSGPFASYEEALKCYDEIELDETYGIGQAFIEDRQCGTVTEKWLTRKIVTEYGYSEYDNSKCFYAKDK